MTKFNLEMENGGLNAMEICAIWRRTSMRLWKRTTIFVEF